MATLIVSPQSATAEELHTNQVLVPRYVPTVEAPEAPKLTPNASSTPTEVIYHYADKYGVDRRLGVVFFC